MSNRTTHRCDDEHLNPDQVDVDVDSEGYDEVVAPDEELTKIQSLLIPGEHNYPA